jgi:hypothetical protein
MPSPKEYMLNKQGLNIYLNSDHKHILNKFASMNHQSQPDDQCELPMDKSDKERLQLELPQHLSQPFVIQSF